MGKASLKRMDIALANQANTAEDILNQAKGVASLKLADKPSNRDTYKVVYEIVEMFRKVSREVNDSIDFWEKEVNVCDQAFGDIRHLAETRHIDSKKRTRAFKLLREYSLRRREAKDNLAVLQAFGEFITKHRNVWQELDGVYGKMKKEMAHVTSERVYNPRVLAEIFDM